MGALERTKNGDITRLFLPQTKPKSSSSDFLCAASFQKEGFVVQRVGLEPATSGDITRKPNLFLVLLRY